MDYIVNPNDFKLAEEVFSFEEETVPPVVDIASVDAQVLAEIAEKPLAKLSQEERDYVASVVDLIKKESKKTHARLNAIEDQLDQTIMADIGKGKNFDVDVEDRNIKSAIKRAFGVKTKTITYEMYKLAIKELEKLDQKESKEYVKGGWAE